MSAFCFCVLLISSFTVLNLVTIYQEEFSSISSPIIKQKWNILLIYEVTKKACAVFKTKESRPISKKQNFILESSHHYMQCTFASVEQAGRYVPLILVP